GPPWTPAIACVWPRRSASWPCATDSRQCGTASAWWRICGSCSTPWPARDHPPQQPSPPMSEVFDQVFSLLTPERLLRDPRATGEGVTVCVIDSGVERGLLEERHRQRGQAIERIEGGVFTADQAEPQPYDGHQSTPHGTTVADILLTLAPRVRLYSADVFGPQGSCEVEVVLRALHWAINVWKCKVINLSLGVAENRLQQLPRRQQLQRAIEEGYYKDVLMFAAAHNEHPLTRSYPSAFTPPLLSVDKSLFDDPLQFAYQLRDQI